MSIDDVDKFKQKEMKQMKLINNTWYDWLINYIPKPIRKEINETKNTKQHFLNKKRKKVIINLKE